MTENRTSDTIAESLAGVLFNGREDTDLAGLFCREDFAYREVSTAREALRLSYDRLRLVHESVGPARELLAREAELLVEAERLLPRFLVGDIDVLVVDEIGTDISGAGMDPNITGRT